MEEIGMMPGLERTISRYGIGGGITKVPEQGSNLLMNFLVQKPE